ncbi:hypothetical protein ACLOJK_011685 [Asimina triloba]
MFLSEFPPSTIAFRQIATWWWLAGTEVFSVHFEVECRALPTPTKFGIHAASLQPCTAGQKLTRPPIIMAMEQRSDRAHVLLLPYPTQGHINPMLQFAKRLVSKGVKATLAATIFISNTVQFDTGAISVVPISDGCDQGGFAEAGSVSDYLKRLEAAGSRTLGDLIEQLSRSGQNVTCLVYDAFFPWALDVANKLALPGAAFFTQMCIVDAIYYHVYHGNVAVPLAPEHHQTAVRLPGLPPLKIDDMPSFIAACGSYPAYKELVLDQFRNLEKADWVLLNTFHELEPQSIKAYSSSDKLNF